ncbi:MAG: hypothetical protein GYB33_10820 [Gammaproteobacteria bacterium]|uniref:Zn-ribbon domain-containing OB-fold protein n=1 Tax=Pseudomaricurvus alcaniphilus TaxID=1166482 RepID=UPI00140C41B1|nr:OB-fold domain-containing protein [Pseudomaricurvus alcaniphilus]MBR9910827.1 hypothetical protein [Gammaproteobacteria bacterium]NHN37295.1 hypothetical protein [Pseudomaricurvus alcaniphilus]
MAAIRPDLDYLNFLKEGKFCIQRSTGSGEYVFYPRTIAPGSGCDDLEWVAAAGRGTVYSTTTVRARPPKSDYNVALIELQEGPRMMSRVEGVAPDQVRIGMPVKARIFNDGEQPPYVVFDPA